MGFQPNMRRIIRALIPIRDAVRDVLRAQESNRPWGPAQVRLRVAYAQLPCAISARSISPPSRETTDPDTGETRETQSRPNLQPFLMIPTSGSSPRSRTTTSRAEKPNKARSLPNASCIPPARPLSKMRPTPSPSPCTRSATSISTASPNCSAAAATKPCRTRRPRLPRSAAHDRKHRNLANRRRLSLRAGPHQARGRHRRRRDSIPAITATSSPSSGPARRSEALGYQRPPRRPWIPAETSPPFPPRSSGSRPSSITRSKSPPGPSTSAPSPDTPPPPPNGAPPAATPDYFSATP